jgi:hypothetical protein
VCCSVEAPTAIYGSTRRRGVKGGITKPSTVVLLKNMVSAEEVDPLLAHETTSECRRYGEVKSCQVYVVGGENVNAEGCVVSVDASEREQAESCPDEQRVRTFVKFVTQEAAVRAYKELNGRYFGGRQITAVFYDESKYSNGQLAPELGEW